MYVKLLTTVSRWEASVFLATHKSERSYGGRISALDTVLVICIVLQILVLTLMTRSLLTLYAPLAVLAHRNILLVRISTSLAGRLFTQSKLSLCFLVVIHSVPFPLVVVLLPVLAICLISFHYYSLLIISTSLKHLLSSCHTHIFFSNIVIGSLQNISRLGFLQLLLLHSHF